MHHKSTFKFRINIFVSLLEIYVKDLQKLNLEIIKRCHVECVLLQLIIFYDKFFRIRLTRRFIESH